MANKVLDQLTKRTLDRAPDRWVPQSALVRDKIEYDDLEYLTRFRLTLTSGAEYVIYDRYVGDLHPAHEHAERMLAHHLYGQQVEIAHKAMSALYGGAGRDEVANIIGELLESMRP